MFALRNISRAAPRSVARLSTLATRPQSSVIRRAALQPAWTHIAPRLTSSFHISAARREENVNEELVAKLQNEISLEEDMKEDDDLSTNIKEYLENSAFEVEDKPGMQEVILTRTYGDEKIRIVFSTQDLNNVSDAENAEDNAMFDNDVDEIVDGQSGGANTKGSINQGNTRDGNFRIAPEDRIAPADREELDDEYDEEGQQGFPAHANIVIERPGKGALAIEATAQDGDFLIEDVAHFPTVELANAKSAEESYKRQSLYTGPPFTNLDEDLQILLEKYLEERGINTRMALFIPDYIDHKEQKEYIRWLKNVKAFVE